MKMCGNSQVSCGYREGKFCKKPKEFKCNKILHQFDKEGNIKHKINPENFDDGMTMIYQDIGDEVKK